MCEDRYAEKGIFGLIHSVFGGAPDLYPAVSTV